MISAQCNELRKTADELDERAKAYGPTAHNVLSPMLRRAADTIWGLRCKLADVVDQQGEIVRLEAENERLRKLAEKSESRSNMIDAIEMPKYDGMEYEELVVAAQYMWLENAKLRDAMYTNAGKHALQHMDEDELRIWATQQSEYIEELKELAREMRSDLLPIACPWVGTYDKRMRELGIEVDDDD